MNIVQLSFTFTYSVKQPDKNHHRVNWRVTALARKYRMPISYAAVCASEMRLPVDEFTHWGL